MVRTLREILVILCFLACLTLAVSSALEVGRRLLGAPGLDREYWGTLLGGLALLALLLLLLTCVDVLTVGLAH